MSSVKLISLTKPALDFEIETQAVDANDLIAYCARVSNPSNQENFDTAGKLLRYCVKKKHWSIFEMADVTFEIKCTRDIGRQILRHRSFTFQEFSQRYASPKAKDFVIRECRFQDDTNRQSSIEVNDNDDDEIGTAMAWEQLQIEHLEKSLKLYNWAINSGIAKEQARVVLPEGMTPSVMYMKGSVRSWYHYCSLRMDMGTQKEHRVIAKECFDKLIVEFPFLNKIESIVE